MILFLIFIQLLSEISLECKERAVLLYKFFKTYFVEQEKKWFLLINRMNDKIKYYKDLCKAIVQQKNRFIDKIERINDVLFNNKPTNQNLQDHKKLIQDLLQVINEKRKELYLLNSNNEILEKELKFWVFDIDSIKLSSELRVTIYG